jgi:hypothetical protein
MHQTRNGAARHGRNVDALLRQVMSGQSRIAWAKFLPVAIDGLGGRDSTGGRTEGAILLEVASGYQVLILSPEGYDYVGGLTFEGYGLLLGASRL